MRRMHRLFIFCLLLIPAVSLIRAQQDGLSPDLPPITAANATQLTPLLGLESPLDVVSSVTFSPDGRFMVLAGLGGIVLYNTSDLSSFAIVETTPLVLEGGVAFSPDSQTMVSAGLGYLQVWDMATGTPVDRFPTAYPPGVIRFSPDGAILAVTAATLTPSDTPIDGSVVYLWDIATGQQFATAGYPYSWLSRGGSVPFYFAYDALWTVYPPLVHEWQLSDPTANRDPLLLTQDDYLSRLTDLRFAPDANRVYDWTPFRDADERIALWLENDTDTLFLVEDGTQLAVTAGDIPAQIEDFVRLDRAERVQVLDRLQDLQFPLGDEVLTVVNRRAAAVTVPRFSYDGATLTDNELGIAYTATDDGIAGRFEDADGNTPYTLQVFFSVGDIPAAETVFQFDSIFYLSDDGRVVAELSRTDAGVLFQNFDTGDDSFLTIDPTQVDGIVFSHDNALALVDTGGTDFLVDVETGASLVEFPQSVNATFHPQGITIVTQWQGQLTFWALDNSSM